MSTRKCTEFCSNNCDGEHHAVLTALAKTRSNKESLMEFRQLLRAYQIHGFRFDSSVPDPHPDFRYPLLHWAVVLGKSEVVKFLLKPPFNVEATLKSNDGETALHRLLNVMDDGKANLSLLLEMVDLLKPCLTCVDDEAKTPLHLCADILASCQKKELEVWKKVFKKMLDVAVVTKKSKTKQILNSRDTAAAAAGDTVLNYQDAVGDALLHILSKREELLELVEYVLRIGGGLDVSNKAGETPVEVAWRFSMPTYNLYQMLKFSPVIEDQTSDDESECSSENYVLDGSEIQTRASLGLSETKDYTEFFDENMPSESDDDEYYEGDDDDEDDNIKINNKNNNNKNNNNNNNNNSNNNKNSLKRKLSAINISLSDCLEELSTSSPSPPPHHSSTTKPKKSAYNGGRRGRPVKRMRLLVETSESENEGENEKVNCQPTKKKKNARRKVHRRQIHTPDADRYCSSDKDEDNNQEANEWKFVSIKKELRAIGVYLKSPSREEKLELNADLLRERITNTIRGIKELFQDESSDDNDVDEESDVCEDDSELEQMKEKEKLLDRKIDVLKNAINKLTSL